MAVAINYVRQNNIFITLNLKNKLRDSVKHLDTIFFEKNNEFFQVGSDFPSRPLHEIFNAGHDFFNDNGQKLERRFFKK